MVLTEILLGLALAVTVFVFIFVGLGLILRKKDSWRIGAIVIAVIAAFVLNTFALIYDVFKTADGTFIEKSFLYVIAVLKGASYTAAMFVFKDNLENLGVAAANNVFCIVYYVMITLIYVVVSVSVISMVSHRFYSYLKLKFNGFVKVYAFTALNERSFLLATDIAQQAQRKREKSAIVILFKKFTKSESSLLLAQKAKDKGFLFCIAKNKQGDFFQNYPLLRKCRKKDMRVFCFEEDFKSNVDFINRYPANDYEAYVLTDEHFAVSDLPHPEKVHRVSERKCTADMLFSSFPLSKMKYREGKNDAVNFMLIGKGPTGEEIFKTAYMLTQNADCDFYASLFDRSICEGIFYQRYPELEKDDKIKFYESAIEKSNFYSLFKGALKQNNAIVVTLGEDMLNIKVTELLYGMLQKNPKFKSKIFVRLKDVRHQKLLDCCDYDNVQIAFFGDLKQLYKKDFIVGEINDAVAKSINEQYCKLSGYEKEWGALSEGERDSNRSVALCKDAMLANIGLELAGLDDPRPAVSYEDLPPETIEKAAFNEHLRWNAFHIIHGWQRLPLDRADLIELLKDGKGGYKSKDENKKLHTCLTHFSPLNKKDKESLDAVSEFLKRDMKAYDYMWLKVIFSVAPQFEQKVVPI